jgi:hypothetical protein
MGGITNIGMSHGEKQGRRCGCIGSLLEGRGVGLNPFMDLLRMSPERKKLTEGQYS